MSRKPKIYTIGGATFDVFVKAGEQSIITVQSASEKEKYLALPHGAKVKVEDVLETFGGGATNTAVTFAKMGFDVCFVGMVGQKYGDRVFENLHKSGVSCAHAKKSKKDKTGFSTIINTIDGDRTLLYYAGANKYFTAKDLPLDNLADADWIFISHLAAPKNGILEALLKLLKKHPHIKVAWNPGHEQIHDGMKKWKALLARTDALFLNKHEASVFTGLRYKIAGNKKPDPKAHVCQNCFLPPYADDTKDILKAICATGVKNVVITDGRKGAQATDGKNHYFCPVVSHKRVDTLGAGDAFASGVTSALIQGQALKTALIYGTLNAGNVVNYPGAQNGLLDKDEIKEAIEKHKIEVNKSKL